MEQTLRTLTALCLELVGLALLASLLIVVAAFHYFDGFGAVSAGDALIFSMGSVILTALALIVYALVRIGRLKVENKHLHHAATRDGLTRLLNRTAFKREAERLIGTMGRRRGDPAELTLLIVDADHFKRINDRLGHGVGDQALVAIASTLAGGLRQDDLVGRLGGEEFVVLLRNAGPAEAGIVAERLRATINRLVVGPKSAPARLSVSLGGVSFDRPIPFDLAYRQADSNLYKAKKNGRNRSELGTLAQNLRAPRTERLLTRLANEKGGPRALRL